MRNLTGRCSGHRARRILVWLITVVLTPVQAWSQEGDAHAVLRDLKGRSVGEAMLSDTPRGVLMKLSLVAVLPGAHALHLHQTGTCEPPFESAGGHLSPDGKRHGFLDPEGAHAGDLPNIVVPDSGRIELELLVPDLSLDGGGGNGLLDSDGSALVIHQKPDDYRSDPSGEAGQRIACGEIEAGSS